MVNSEFANGIRMFDEVVQLATVVRPYSRAPTQRLAQDDNYRP